MSTGITAPKVDDRTFDTLREDLLALAREWVPEWDPDGHEDVGDPGLGLVAVYAHFIEILLDRLGRAPDKNLLAFLDMIGVGRLAPGAASTPLVFSLSETAGEAAVVATGTQVATQQTATLPAVVFETQSGLPVIAAQVATAHVVDPARDRWTDVTAVIQRTEARVFAPFAGERRIAHLLHLGHDRLFGPAHPARLELDIRARSTEAARGVFERVAWKRSTEDGWEPLHDPELAVLTSEGEGDTLGGSFLRLTFQDFAGAAPRPLAGPGLTGAIEPRWLRARLNRSITDLDSGDLGGASFGEVTARIVQEHGIPPDQVHVNAAPVDFSKPFVAFSAVPRPGDALQVGSAEAFARPDAAGQARATLDVTIRTGDVSLEWAAWDGNEWEALTVAEDETADLTRSGSVRLEGFPGGEGSRVVRVTLADGTYERVPTFTRIESEGAVPANVWVSTVRSDPTGGAPLAPLDPEDWILPFGPAPGIGASFYFELDAGQTAVTIVTPAPPTLRWEYLGPAGWSELSADDGTNAFTADGRVEFDVPEDVVIGEVNGQKSAWVRAMLVSGAYGRQLELVQVDPSDPARGFIPRQGTGAPNAPVVGSVKVEFRASTPALAAVAGDDFLLRDESERLHGDSAALQPFRPVPEQDPALYLGFDRPLPNQSFRLYFVVPPGQFAELLEPPPDTPVGDPAPQLAWEYWDGHDWSPLAVVDATTSLAESGSVDVTGPTQMGPLVRAAVDARWWIRVRRVEAGESYAPTLSHVLLNATVAVQATTILGELLGSSAGRRGERFITARRPVLPGQRVVVIEPERPPGTESGEVVARPFDAGGYVVLWEEVVSLRASTARDRHYTIDRITGEIVFGDGDHGLIPPAGLDNVICEIYRAGGGAAGNAAAGAVSQLKSSIPYVAEVVNPTPAGGGSDAEDAEAAKQRGPRTVRHRGRAVSADDLESLALEAAGTAVARARVLPSRNRELRFAPGWTTLVIVPQGDETRLLPNAELIDRVHEEIGARSLATLAGAAVPRLNVIGPGYVPVEVRTAIVPRDFAGGEAARRSVFDELERFLHPLRGGPDGTGWTLGRDVFVSELFAALERLPGIEHVDRLDFAPTAAVTPLVLAEGTALTAKVPEGGAIVILDGSGDDLVRARLVEDVEPGTKTAAAVAMSVLFQEGERIKIGGGSDRSETTVRGISGTTLTVDPFRADDRGYGEGVIVTALGSSPEQGATKPRRSVLTEPIEQGVLADTIEVRGFRIGDTVRLEAPETPAAGPEAGLRETSADGSPRLELGTRIRIPESHLPYSGAHVVDLVGA